MFQRILAPVDLADSTTSTVQYAGFFARHFGAEVTLLYADEMASLFGGYDSQFVGLHIPAGEQVAKHERALQKLAASHLNGIPASVIAIPAPAVSTIVQVATEKKSDLIVMGSQRGASWRHALIGSVADGVVRTASQPVLVAPTRTFPDAIRRVVCPVNFTAASRGALDYASRIADAFRAELLLVHVHEADGIDSETVHDRFRSYVPPEMRKRCLIRELVLHGGAAERVLDCIDGEGAELLVMGTQQVAFRTETVIGTTSERLLRFSPVPVLSVTRKPVAVREESEVAIASS